MLRPPPVRVFENQVQDFCRSVRLHYKYANQPEDPDFKPKLYMKSGWNPPRENPNIEDNLYKLRHDLLEDFQGNFPCRKNNLSREERLGLQELKANPTVRVLATDKNLGPALVSTEWLEKETLKHLHETNSYAIVTKDDWMLRRKKVIENRERLIKTYFSFLPPRSGRAELIVQIFKILLMIV